MEIKEGEIVKERETDLLIGVVSFADDINRHYLLADFDNIDEESLLDSIRYPLFEKRKFGRCYIVKSGKGYHLLNFTNSMTTDEYISVLKEMKYCDPKFIEWVERVRYGVLRLSRRSSHGKVPELQSVVEGYNSKEDENRRMLYFSLLGLEKNYNRIRRVKVSDSDIKMSKSI